MIKAIQFFCSRFYKKGIVIVSIKESKKIKAYAFIFFYKVF